MCNSIDRRALTLLHPNDFPTNRRKRLVRYHVVHRHSRQSEPACPVALLRSLDHPARVGLLLPIPFPRSMETSDPQHRAGDKASSEEDGDGHGGADGLCNAADRHVRAPYPVMGDIVASHAP
jgi:hypothetical protein